MSDRQKGQIAVIASCAAIFWPGAFIFGFPGVMGQHWQQTLEVSRAATGRTLFFALAAVGVFMFITGRWQEKVGPSKLAALGALLCGGSTLLVGYAESLGWVYFWAFLMGASSSLVYIPGLTVVQRWFPARRGLVSGCVNLAFGISAAIMSPVFTLLLGSMSYRGMTLLLGLAALAVGLAASRYVRFPEAKEAAAKLTRRADPCSPALFDRCSKPSDQDVLDHLGHLGHGRSRRDCHGDPFRVLRPVQGAGSWAMP